MNWPEFLTLLSHRMKADRVLLQDEFVRLREELLPFGQEKIRELEELVRLLAQYDLGLAWEFYRVSPSIMGLTDLEAPLKLGALGCAVWQRSPLLALYVIREGSKLISQANFETVKMMAALCEAIARYSITYARRVWDEGTHLVQVIKECGVDTRVIPKILHLLLRAVPSDWSSAFRLLEKFSQVVAGLKKPVEELIKEGERFVFDARLLEAYLDGFFRVLINQNLAYNQRELIGKVVELVGKKNPESAEKLMRSLSKNLNNIEQEGEISSLSEILEYTFALAEKSGEVAETFVSTIMGELKTISLDDLSYVYQKVRDLNSLSHFLAQAFILQLPMWWRKLKPSEREEIISAALEIGKKHPEVAIRLFEVSFSIVGKGNVHAWREVKNFVTFIADQDRSAAIRFLERASDKIYEINCTGGMTLLAITFEEAYALAARNVRLAISFVESSVDIYRVAGCKGVREVAGIVKQFDLDRWSVAVGLIKASAAIIERVGFPGLHKTTVIARNLARKESYDAVGLWNKVPEILDRLGDHSLALRVLETVDEISQINGRVALSFLEAAPQVSYMVRPEGLEKMRRTMSTIAYTGQAGKRLVELSPIIMERMGSEGWEILCKLVSHIHSSSPDQALQVVEGCLPLLDQLDAIGEGAASLKVFSLALDACQVSPLFATALLERSAQMIDWLGLRGFEIIGHHLLTVAAMDEQEALDMLIAPPDALTTFAAGVPKGVTLREIKPLLTTYLKALLGRKVEVKEGKYVRTDGKYIYLPAKIRDYENWTDNFRLYKVWATFEEAKLEWGGWSFSCERIKDEVDRVVERYGKTFSRESEEDDLTRFCLLFPEPALIEDLLEIMERYRLEQILLREFPGLRKDIEEVNRHQIKKRVPPEKMLNMKRRAVEIVARALMTGLSEIKIEDPTIAGIWERSQKWVKVLNDAGTDIHASARVAIRIYEEITGAIRDPYRRRRLSPTPTGERQRSINIGSFSRAARELERHLQGVPLSDDRGGLRIEREGADRGESLPSDRSPSQFSPRESKKSSEHLGRTRRGTEAGTKGKAGQKSTTDESPPHVHGLYAPEKIERLLKSVHRLHGLTPEEVERRVSMMLPFEAYLFIRSLEHSLENDLELMSEPGTFLYPEWDSDKHDYRINWVRVREHALSGGNFNFYQITMEKYRGLIKKIRREFQLLRPESLKRRKRQREGEEIDIDAFVEYLIDRRLNMSPSERNYIMTQKARRDIAVAFLVDMSRSTKGAVIEREKEALIVMSEALNEVGDAFGIFGFSGDNRDNVDFYIVKDFDEPYGELVKGRISSITDRYENRDGAAIRHVSSILRKRKERAKILILISDGKPVDKEYHGEYAVEDTRMALKEAYRDGIRSFCITVDEGAAEYLPRMYSQSRWVVIDDVAHLPERITGIYRTLAT
ncbi:MAG: VWA domain-containing protein [Syntrophales bacterium]|nr:VWA domain-containing protein [Syntrophales bacterium]